MYTILTKDAPLKNHNKKSPSPLQDQGFITQHQRQYSVNKTKPYDSRALLEWRSTGHQSGHGSPWGPEKVGIHRFRYRLPCASAVWLPRQRCGNRFLGFSISSRSLTNQLVIYSHNCTINWYINVAYFKISWGPWLSAVTRNREKNSLKWTGNGYNGT